MRKNIIFSCIVGSTIIILGQFGFFDAILLFFLAGIIPGTHHSISSTHMFYSIVISISAIIVWLTRGTLFHLIDEIILKISPSEKTKKRLPRRRFSEI